MRGRDFVTQAAAISGHCLCGAVAVDVARLGDGMSACHCDMCRRWTGSAFVSVHSGADDVTLSGPIKTRETSEWAERGWCDECGSTLFYRVKHDGSYGLSAGLFDDAAGRGLTQEYYVDKKPAGWAFAGDHKRMNTGETLAFFGVSEGDQP